MHLANKRAVDYYAGRPLLVALQIAARVLGAVLRRDHAVYPVRSILIAKFQGLGSLVMCKPALAALRRQQPSARIIFWGTPSLLPLAREMPEFDEILILDDRSFVAAVTSTVAALFRLWREHLDWAFDLEVYSRLSSVVVTLTAARNRSGFALEQLRSRRVHTHLVYFNRHAYVGEAYARLLGQLLPAGQAVDLADYGRWRFDAQPLAGIPRPYFVFNIHAGELSLERRWPRASFERLIDELLGCRPDAVATLIGFGEAEIAYAAGLPSHNRIIDLSGKLTLVETFRLIANAELVVTNDSAPMHLALSSGTRVVGLFGPTRAATYLPPGRTGLAEAHVNLYCSPCVHYWEPPPCNGDNRCMKDLPVARVLARCCDLLGLPPGTVPVEITGTGTGESAYYPGLVYRTPSRG